MAKGVRPAPGARHLCYCHTPMRYVWDRYDDYFGPGRASPLARLAIRPIAARLRAWDARTAARVHRFAANSAYVAGRIRRYYGRDSVVIPPPVDTAFFTPGADRPGAYDLVVSALAPYKRLDLVLDAYRGTGWPLRIVGTGPEEARLRAPGPARGGVPRPAGRRGAARAVPRLPRRPDARGRGRRASCRSRPSPAARPAVVFGEGGGAETVEHGTTGLVFHEPTAAALRAAVSTLQTARFDRLALRARAEALRREVFEERVRAFVDDALGHGDPGC